MAETHDLRTELHAHCVACGEHGDHCLGLRMQGRDDGSVEGAFAPAPWMRGYNDRLHGGIVATVLDSAMTQCLLMQGVAAYTVKMEIRFRNAAPREGDYRVVAWREESRSSVHDMQATLSLGNTPIATASARFFETDEAREPATRGEGQTAACQRL